MIPTFLRSGERLRLITSGEELLACLRLARFGGSGDEDAARRFFLLLTSGELEVARFLTRFFTGGDMDESARFFDARFDDDLLSGELEARLFLLRFRGRSGELELSCVTRCFLLLRFGDDSTDDVFARFFVRFVGDGEPSTACGRARRRRALSLSLLEVLLVRRVDVGLRRLSPPPREGRSDDLCPFAEDFYRTYIHKYSILFLLTSLSARPDDSFLCFVSVAVSVS
jgi:hypothetical protein